jgi:hypothetical protein
MQRRVIVEMTQTAAVPAASLRFDPRPREQKAERGHSPRLWLALVLRLLAIGLIIYFFVPE